MSSSSPADTAGLSAGPERQNPYLRLQSVTVFVRDVERSLRFYVDQLGFVLVFDGRVQPGRRFVTVAPPDGSANLTLVAPKAGSDAYKLIGRPTLITFVTEDVIAKFQQWRKRGVVFQHAPRLKRLEYQVRLPNPPSMESSGPSRDPAAPIWGGVFTRFKDIDGNSFALVGFDEINREIEAQRRAAAEKLEIERRAARELEIAKEVQARLFPQSQPTLQTLDYFGVCHQARQVGGDYYDFLRLGENRLGLVIGDIAGKGIAASLLMANLQANLRSQCAISWDEPRRLLRAVNQLFCENTTDGAYATLFFAEYDDHTQRLRYINCGHLSGLLLRDDDTLEQLDSTCTILGYNKDLDCPMSERQLSPGDMLLLYTDGITESFDAAGQEFGQCRLVEALRSHRQQPSRILVQSIVEEVRRFSSVEQSDDITLIAAKCGPRESA